MKAVTICNMNQAQKSAVNSIPYLSEDFSVVQSICGNSLDEDVNSAIAGKWSDFRRVLSKVSKLQFSIKELVKVILNIMHIMLLGVSAL